MTAPTAPVTGPGHGPDVWRDRVTDAARRSLADLRALVPGRHTLVVVSAHPDDESIGAGRLLAAWVRTGGRARAVLATDGEACVDHVGTRPDGIAARRRAEWRRALDLLGVEAGDTLALPDGGLPEAAADLDRAVVATLAPDVRGSTVLLAPHPLDPHPDHRAVGRAVARVGRRLGVPVWSFPVWLTYWSDPSTDLGNELVVVDVEEADERAWRSAVTCFESQLLPLGDGWGAIVPPAMLAHHDRQLLLPEDAP